MSDITLLRIYAEIQVLKAGVSYNQVLKRPADIQDNMFALMDKVEELKQLESKIGHDNKVSICPVCNGRGKLRSRFYDTHHDNCLMFDRPEKEENKIKCRSCNGKGYLVIEPKKTKGD